jgi:hypothetical protein
LRYSDGPSVEVDIVVAASPDVVWRFVSDISLPARFSTELVGAEWLDGATGAALGARFVGHSRHAAIGEWETTSTVYECRLPEAFGWAVGDPEDPSARWRFTLAPEGSGTRLTQWIQMGPARSGINIAIDAMPDKEFRILERRLGEHRANMEATLAGIRAIAEESQVDADR